MHARAASVSRGTSVPFSAAGALLLSVVLTSAAFAQVSLEREWGYGSGNLDNGGWGQFSMYPNGPYGYWAVVDYADGTGWDSGGGAVPAEAVTCDPTFSQCTVALTVTSFYDGSDLDVVAELTGDGPVTFAAAPPYANGTFDPDDPSSSAVQVVVLQTWRNAVVTGSFSSSFRQSQGSLAAGNGSMSRQHGVFLGGQ